MKLFFAGGEVDSHRRLLEENGHRTIAMSYVGLTRRTKFKKPWTVDSRFDPATEVLLDSGAYSFNKENSAATEEQAMTLAINYMGFVRQNLDRLSGVTEFDALILGEKWIEATREDFYCDLGDRFIPVWHSLSGYAELQRLAGTYGRVGILQDDTDDEDYEGALHSLATDGIRLHGIGMTRTRSMRQIAWDSVSSTSWLSPIQYGDLIIFDANRLHRYPRTRREHGLKAYSGKLESQGFDVDAIAAGESYELLRLSAWSWDRYVSWVNNADPEPATDNLDDGPGRPGEPREPGTALARPEPRERALLPLIGVTEQDLGGEDDDGKPAEQLLTSSPATLMQCSTCYIRRECPEFTEGAACKFEIPVMVESGNQLRAVLNTIIRIQTQRALLMTMMEQAKGGYADQNTGAEIDRLARLVKLRNDAEKASFSFTISGSASSPQAAGYLSSVFGSNAGDRATQLAEPVPAAEILGSIVDAEVVE